jgi:hypothetical protein
LADSWALVDWRTTFAAFACVVSLAALVVSFRATSLANRLSQTTPWATCVFGHVQAELLNAWEDRGHVRQLVNVPFPGPVEKKAHVAKINLARDGSAKNVYMLGALAEGTEAVQRLQAARDTVDHPFWENDEAAMEPAEAAAFLDRYEAAAKAYSNSLRAFAGGLSSRRLDHTLK